ncbi:DUF637 domain-containing protein [Psychromonas sp. Urea-02u-13]|uniref:DUF637 domain-containing protein n=1 Tax=Psychromonas sp. Urea-02u-13 TaxID=2058326 RepID=UPI000C345E24|nr:DUF637 domain-containing protein [Psychromonas sp. Urea-02u-13]PKG40862.1 hypothetical protein CXF74_00645 [Psychromonas sp. Urea-02u-13]
MKKNNRLNKVYENCIQKFEVWRKITSSLLVFVLLAQTSSPVFAALKLRSDIATLEETLTRSVKYRSTANTATLYDGLLAPEINTIFDGFDYFYQQATARYVKQFEGYKLVPIAGDITIFIPVAPAKPLFIGTPYIEREVIRLQLNQIINRSMLINGKGLTYNTMVKGLYNNALEFMGQKNIKFGQALTEAQIKGLSKSIIWPEKVHLSTGKAVVIPYVYLSQKDIHFNRVTRTTLSVIDGSITSNNFIMDGTNVIFARDGLIKVEESFSNTNGYVKALGDLTIMGRDISNLSGTISGHNVNLIASSITNKTLVTRLDYEHGFSEQAGKIATINAIDTLNLNSAGDILIAGGELNSQGTLSLNAGNSVYLLPTEVREEHEEHAQSGKNWSESSSSLINLPTKLSAIDIVSIVAANEIVAQGAIIESQGMIEMLAGMGITIIPAEDIRTGSKSYESSTSGVFGSDESMSEEFQKSEIVRSLLKAGNSLNITTKMGDITLQAVAVDSKGIAKIVAENGSIDIQLAKMLDQYSYEESYEGSLSFRYQGHGHYREVAYYSEFIAEGGLILEAHNGVRVEYTGAGKSIDEVINELSTSPELAWLAEVRNHPDANFEEIKLQVEEWSYDNAGLTPAAQALMAVIMTLATGPGGLAAAIGVNISNVVISAAVSAGINALTTQAASSLLANGFDIKETFSDLASKETFISLATSMVTAGVLAELDVSFFGAVEKGINATIPEGVINNLTTQAVNSIYHTVVEVNIASLMNGEGFTSIDDFDKVVLNAFAMSAINMLGKELANKIHEANIDTDANPIPSLDTASKYIAHAALGCGLAGLTSVATGSNSSENSKACLSGAGGGVLGEYIAEQYRAEIEAKAAQAKLFVEGELATAAALKNGPYANWSKKQQAEYTERVKGELIKLNDQGIDIARLGAGLIVFIAGGDVDSAIKAGGNAAENNALFLIPLIIKAFALASWASTAYTVYATIDKIIDILNGKDANINVEDALIDLAVTLAVDLSVKKLKTLKIDELFTVVTDRLDDLGMSGLSYDMAGVGKGFDLDGNPNGHVPSSPKRDIDGAPIKVVYKKADLEAHAAHLKVAPSTSLNPEEVGSMLASGKVYNPSTQSWGLPPGIKRTELKADKNKITTTPETLKLEGNDYILDGKRNTPKQLEIARAYYKNLADKELDTEKASFYRHKMGLASEQLGNAATDAYAKHSKLLPSNRIDATLPNYKGKNNQFDDIYEQDGKLIIFEAKGTSAATPKLSGQIDPDNNKIRHMQGSRRYTELVIDKMEKHSKTLTGDKQLQLQGTVAKLRNHLDNNTLEYKMVIQNIDKKTGDLGPVTIKDYDQKLLP